MKGDTTAPVEDPPGSGPWQQSRGSATGSRDELESHTEQCMNTRTRPDYLAPTFLHRDPHAATFVLSTREVQAALPSDAVALLREVRYLTGADASFVDGGVSDEVRGPMPVLSGAPYDPSISYDQDMMFPQPGAPASSRPRHSDLAHTSAQRDPHPGRAADRRQQPGHPRPQHLPALVRRR